MKSVFTFLAIFCCGVSALFGQKQDSSSLTFSGYVEPYYVYNLSHSAGAERPDFLYNHTRMNEVNINLAFVKAAYSAKQVRANLALMAGTYAQRNLSAEPGVLKNLLEANAGMKLAKNLWLDAGVFSSHIGFESAVSKDCWTLSRSLIAENTPYFETGARLGWTPNDQWTINVLVLNGWQHIQRPAGHTHPAWGTQVTFKPKDAITLNWSTFLGNEYPNDAARLRIHHNLYGTFQISPKWGLIANVDFCLEQKSAGSSDYSKMVSPVLVVRNQMSKRWAWAFRLEQYNDPSGIFIPTGTAHGFKTSGYSLNVDYQPAANCVWRVEGRFLRSQDALFDNSRGSWNNHWNAALLSSIAISF